MYLTHKDVYVSDMTKLSAGATEDELPVHVSGRGSMLDHAGPRSRTTGPSVFKQAAIRQKRGTHQLTGESSAACLAVIQVH